MNRFWRINTIWRKELIDTIRDRRTLIAMVLVPMVLYPALMLGSISALEVQVSYLVQEEYTVGVQSELAQVWLNQVIDSDPARRAPEAGLEAEELIERLETEDANTAATTQPGAAQPGGTRTATASVVQQPPEYQVVVVGDVPAAVLAGRVHAGLVLERPPRIGDLESSTEVIIAFDESDIRSEIAASGLQGILARQKEILLAQRLAAYDLSRDFIEPLDVAEINIATAERMAGSVLGQIVPLILIIMTITGAIYPAIDLTAGERERGTLETLMVAPVPTLDLIAGKFVVVTLIGLLSALLNLLSVGGTIYFGGIGSILTQGQDLVFPLSALPWIMLLLVPLAVMFSAALLAVCSFARSFKEAQNYIVPVMMAAMIPGIVGILPGTRLEGPILVLPVANIAVLARELFLGRFDYLAITIVMLSTSLYAGAAVAIAAKLFGQEAVLFADAGSIKTLFQRKHFIPSRFPSAAQALLVLVLVYTLNFFIQQGIAQSGLNQGVPFLTSLAITLVVVFVLGPWFAARYMRVNPHTTFKLDPPPPQAWLAALCFGCATWALAIWWVPIQAQFLPQDSQVMEMIGREFAWMNTTSPWLLVFFMALVPALCEELFFRGYALSGLRPAVGKWAAIGITALAFGMAHYSAMRLVPTAALGILFGLLAIQYRSIWPAILAHLLHNGLAILASHPASALRPVLDAIGVARSDDGAAIIPPLLALIAGGLVFAGVLLCVLAPRREAGEA